MKCAFCEADIRPHQLTGGNAHHAHIWPQSDFFDNRPVNKVCACASCNLNTCNRTPERTGAAFQQAGRVLPGESKHSPASRKRTAAAQPQFQGTAERPRSERHKVDPSYIARDLQQSHRIFIQKIMTAAAAAGRRRVLARLGQLTAILRRAWLSEIIRRTG